jgi:hypothetical protein
VQNSLAKIRDKIPLHGYITDSEYFLSAITHTVAMDCAIYQIPGYHLEVIQKIFSAPCHSHIISGAKYSYSEGLDERKELQEWFHSLFCLFFTTVEVDHHVSARNVLPFFSAILSGKTCFDFFECLNSENGFSILNERTPLLVMPLLEVVTLMFSVHEVYYRGLYSIVDSSGTLLPINSLCENIVMFIPWICLAKFMSLCIETVSRIIKEEGSQTSPEIHFSVDSYFDDYFRNKTAKDFMSYIFNLSTIDHPAVYSCLSKTMFESKIMSPWKAFIKTVVHMACRLSYNMIQEKYLRCIKHFGISWIMNENTAIDMEPWLHAVGIDELFDQLPSVDMMEICSSTTTSNAMETTEKKNTYPFACKVLEEWFYSWIGEWDTDLENQNKDEIRQTKKAKHTPALRTLGNIPVNDISAYVDIGSLYSIRDSSTRQNKSYPITKKLSLISVPKDYSLLHRIVSPKCVTDNPALCLVCGAIVSTNGQGQCFAHSLKCGAGCGIFFLIQVS